MEEFTYDSLMFGATVEVRNDAYKFWNGLAIQNSKATPKSHYELRLKIDNFIDLTRIVDAKGYADFIVYS